MSTTTLNFFGSFADLQKILTMICPGGRWSEGHELAEYHTWQGPKIRCWRNGTIHIQGRDGPALHLFDQLAAAITNLDWEPVSFDNKPSPDSNKPHY